MVSEGDTVKKGDTAIIISAMKMESEYKAPKDGVVNKINVKEGDTVEGNQI
jgi:biotin carboxyl carrier protein